jgi:hypothetical protein
MRTRLLLIPLLFSCAPPKGGVSNTAPPASGSFVLTIAENRTDRRDTFATGESPAVTVESDLILSGRVDVLGTNRVLTFYADSIEFYSRQPYVYRTFMSADTIYYRSGGGTSTIDRKGTAEYDSMLSCLFTGPALQVFLSTSGDPDSTVHANERCGSGEYGRINAPVTFHALLLGRDQGVFEAGGQDGRWREARRAPSFSGIGFHPSIQFLYRVVKTTDASLTVTIAADTTIENHRTVMKNGEEVVISRDRFRIGGTLVVDRATGLTRSGELRIRESVELVRPHASGMVVTKDGEYTIRLSFPSPGLFR